MYTAPDMAPWRGRLDSAEGEAGRRWHEIVQPLRPEHNHGVALTGFACDAGVSRNQGRPGASKGPAAIRAMLANLPVRECASIIEAGTVAPEAHGDDDGLEQAQNELADHLAGLLNQGLLPVTLGGGHEIAVASFEGLARSLQRTTTGAAPRVGIVNLDAHFDLRQDDRPSSGTPFRQIAEACAERAWPFLYCCLGVSDYANTQALFQRAEKLGVVWLRDEEMGLDNKTTALDRLSSFLHSVDHVYLTICLDVLPAAVAPGVSAPAARGVALDVVEALTDAVAKSGKLRLADIAELNPNFDIDNRTARVAARLVARIANKTTPA